MTTLRCYSHAAADAAYRRALQQARPGADPAAVIYPPAGPGFSVSRDADGELVLQPAR